MGEGRESGVRGRDKRERSRGILRGQKEIRVLMYAKTERTKDKLILKKEKKIMHVYKINNNDAY